MGGVTNNMNSLIVLSCLSLVLALPSPEYPTPAPTQEYNPDIGQTNVGGYGVNEDPYCHMVEKVVFENQCEPYVERTCYTQNKESCVTKPFNNCTGVIETNIERVCFDVNELLCDLVEAIHYETLEETFQVQRCFTGKDRVCDTTYKIDMTTKDDYQCTNVETPNRYMEEKVINDVTCTNSVEFNCKRDKSTKNDGYGHKGVVCSRKPTQDCYNIPRKIQVEVCKTDVQVLREVLQHFPLPSRGAELPLRAEEDVRAGDEDSPQESQEVQLHQGLQGAAQGDLRPVREENHPAIVRHPGEAGMHLR